jgi:hypothetical protein
MKTSESIVNIVKALTEAQKQIKNPANTANNPFYKSKYAPLSDILSQARPILSDHGLVITQEPISDGAKVSIATTLLHVSGEYIQYEPFTITAEKLTPQGLGSAITYARRYTVSPILFIASEEDDDGNETEKPKKTEQKPQEKPKVEEKKKEEQKEEIKGNIDENSIMSERMTEDQVKGIYAALKAKHKTNLKAQLTEWQKIGIISSAAPATEDGKVLWTRKDASVLAKQL